MKSEVARCSILIRQSVLVVIIISSMTSHTAAGINYYVTHDGDDDNDCRTLTTPCKTIGSAMRDVKNDDVINVADDDAYASGCRWLCLEKDVIHVPVSVSIVGSGSSTVATQCGNYCPQVYGDNNAEAERLVLFNVVGSDSSSTVRLHLEGLTIVNVAFLVFNGHVTIVNSTVVDSTFSESMSMSEKNITDFYVGLEIIDSVWKTLQTTKTSNNTYEIRTRNVQLARVVIKHSSIIRTPMHILAKMMLFHGTNCEFDGIDELPSVQAGLFLTVRDRQLPSRIVIRECRFQKQVSEDPVESLQNLSDAALYIYVWSRQPDTPPSVNPSNNVTVDIEKSIFSDNERGLTLFGAVGQASIVECVFSDNVAMHAGAGLLVLVDHSTPAVNVSRCTFKRNMAGRFRAAKVVKYKEQFRVNGDEVWVDSECCKGVIAFVGKGGAMRVQQGTVNLIECEFQNNSARLLGGAVFVDREGRLSTDDVTLSNSGHNDHALEGDLMYSIGVVSVRRTRLLVRSASSHVSILCHSGDRWSIETVSIEVECPVGYRLRTTNASIYGIMDDGLIRSYKMDQLSYFCESCPRNKYSLDAGYLNYSTQHSSEEFFTLLINGSYPQLPSRADFYVYRDIVCHPCPYGARCHSGIEPVPNFWGYRYSQALDRVRFQRCQRGYCSLPGSVCMGVDCCRQHRQGVLCGVCRPGYSEAMFTADCVPNSWCDPAIGWPVMLSSGVLYFVFLLFQKNVRELMFSNFQPINSLKRAVSSRRRSTLSSASAACTLHRIPLNASPEETAAIHADLVSANGNGDKQTSRHGPSLTESVNSEPVHRLESDDPTTMIVENGADKTFVDAEIEEVSQTVGPEPEIENDVCEQLYHKHPVDGTLTSPTGPVDHSSAPAKSAPSRTDMGVSFLIIVFFYFQDAQLLHIKTVFASNEKKSLVMFREFLSGLFKFRIEIFQFMDKFCFLADLTPVKKMLVRVGLVPYVLLQFGIAHLLYGWYKRSVCSKRPQQSMETSGLDVGEKNCANVTASDKRREPSGQFSINLATGFVLALLFTYQKLATTSLTLLNCVTVGDRLVLFIQGTIVCYQTWQFAVVGYVATCIVPFCFVVLLGPGLLKDRLITVAELFVAFLLPPPFLLRWIWLRTRRGSETTIVGGNSTVPSTPQALPSLSRESLAVIQILQGPFKESRVPFFGPICGQGLLLGRRLILVLLYTFVNDTLIRMVCMMLLCFAILLHHVHVLPYKDSRGNAAGSASAASLLVVGTINLLRAGFEAAEYVPVGPNETLMSALEQVENVLLLWLPAAVMGFVVASLTLKLFVLGIQSICGRIRKL